MNTKLNRCSVWALGFFLAGSLATSAWAAPLAGIEVDGRTLRVRTGGIQVPYQIERNTVNEVVLFLPNTEVGTLGVQQTTTLGDVKIDAVAGGLRLTYKPRVLGTTFNVVAVGANQQNQAIEIRAAEINAQLPPPPPSAPPAQINVGERVTIKVRDGEIKDTLTLLGRVAKANVVTDSSLTGRVSLNLERVTFPEALDALARIANLSVTKGEGGVYVVSQPKPGQASLPLGDGLFQRTGDPSIRTVSLNVKNAELGTAIENVATQAGAPLIIKATLSDRLTARFNNVPFEKALDQLLLGTRYGYDRQGQTYLVGDVSAGSITGQALQSTESIALAYTSAKNIKNFLPPPLIPYVRDDQSRNTVIVTGTQTLRTQIKNLIREIDKPLKQVVFEVKIISLTESGSRALNALSTVQQGTAFTPGNAAPLSLGGLLSPTTSFAAFNDVARILQIVSGLVTEGKGKLLTDTKLNTVSGEKATLDVQRDINLQLSQNNIIGSVTATNTTIQTLRAGTLVEITPIVQGEGIISAELSLESSVADAQTPNVAPNISRRKVKNKLLIKDGQTIEIGGLIQSSVTETVTRIPILGYIPILGQLFSNTSVGVEQSELIVFLTPRIRDVLPTPEARLPLYIPR